MNFLKNIEGKNGATYKKIEESYNVLMNFRDNSSDEFKKFIDIITPMLYEENKNKLSVVIGRKLKGDAFERWMESSSNNYTVRLSKYNDEPHIYIVNNDTQTSMVTVSLALTKILHIESNEYADYCIIHEIDINYNNEYDFRIRIQIDKE